MSGKHAMVVASEDRAIPVTFAGTIEPNYHCRGWNSKRSKYCSARAGQGTTHPGLGRCKFHGGLQENDGRVTHGQWRTVDVPQIQQRMEAMADADPLDTTEDIQRSRALTDDYVARIYRGEVTHAADVAQLTGLLDDHEALLAERDEGPTADESERVAKARGALSALAAHAARANILDAVKGYENVSKMVHRVQMLKTAGAVSLDQVRRFLAAVDRELQHHVKDDALRERLRQAFYAIRV